MLTPKTSVIPPGGFHYIEKTPSGERRIDGDSLDNLARNLLLFRLANQRAPGNPSQEVSEFICSRWPHFCNDNSPAEIKPSNSAALPGGLAGRIAAWMGDLLRLDNSEQASEQEAQRRAEICIGCRANVSYQSGCGACMDNISRLSFVFKAGRSVPNEGLLQGCAASGQHNPSGVWAKNLPALSPNDASGMPSNCWRLAR